jgi:hypothetical protein
MQALNDEVEPTRFDLVFYWHIALRDLVATTRMLHPHSADCK